MNDDLKARQAALIAMFANRNIPKVEIKKTAEQLIETKFEKRKHRSANLTEDQRERKRQSGREYYQKHKAELAQYNKEYKKRLKELRESNPAEMEKYLQKKAREREKYAEDMKDPAYRERKRAASRKHAAKVRLEKNEC